MGKTLFIEVDGGRLAYEVGGEGPLVVCVPSMGDLRGEYRFLAPKLTDAGFRVIAADLRGLGESSVGWEDYSVVGVARDIAALIERNGGGAAFIVGNSMAAGAAVYLAAERPDLVRALVLIDPFVGGSTSLAMKVLFGTLFADPWGPWAWGKLYDSLYPSRKPADFQAYLADLSANLAEKGRMAALRRMIYASKQESERRLGLVRTSTLVLMGSKDPDFKAPEKEAARVAAELGGTFRMIEGAGHYPHAEFPEETGKLVLEFLESAAEDGAARG